jgi:hypothetical protein
MKKKLTILSLFVFSSFTFLKAQSTKSLTWTEYNLKFQVPADMVVRENSPIVFSGGNGNVFISIYPGKGDTITYEIMPEQLKNWARENKVNYEESSGIYLNDLDGYSAYKIEGTSYRGKLASLVLLVDKRDPKLNFYVWVQYENGYSVPAENMLKTFKR